MKFSRILLGFATLCFAGQAALIGADSRLLNFSTRAPAGAGQATIVTGFVVSGSGSKDLLIRAAGPALASITSATTLAHPRLRIYDHSGYKLAESGPWSSTLADAFVTAGAPALAAGSNDAALRVTLPAGSYAAQVDTSAAGDAGLARLEIYEMGSTGRLLNISTRARLATGSGMLSSTLQISGGSRRMLVRAAGPALAALGVDGALANPLIYIRDSRGSLVAANDDWTSGNSPAAIQAAVAAAGALPFAAGSQDSAALVDLASGTYTIEVRGMFNATGVVLLEVCDVTPDAGTAGSIEAPSAAASLPTKPWLPGAIDIPLPPVIPIYAANALSWSLSDLSTRLGPTFAQLNPLSTDDRPMLYQPVSRSVLGYYVRITPFEIGAGPRPDNDYWSESGQVAYVPDDPAAVGLDRIQTFAYYNHVWATSPRLDYASGKPSPDPQVSDAGYAAANGGVKPTHPVAMARSYGMQQNEAIVIFQDGLFAVAGTQTSRAANERPYPCFKFPANKVPRGLAITTNNEFALVLIWDKDRHQGQLAVVALEGRYLAFHTWPYMGLPNQGSWSDFKLLGYVDLPMSSPDAIAAASNGWWNGPSATGGKVLSQIDLTSDGYRKLVYSGAWNAVVAKNGYALITSKEENKAAIVDLTPLFSYMRESWLSSEDSFAATTAARGAAPSQFPQTFEANPAIMPTVAWTATYQQPTAVLAGQMLDRWTLDRFKAYIATADGTLHILDASPLMWRNSWEKLGKVQEIGSVRVGRNPTGLTWMRHNEAGLPLIPSTSKSDRLNNILYVACRGDREVDGVVTFGGQGQVFRRIRDARMGDPVAVSVAIRGNILTVADYAGKKLLGFRVGKLVDPDDSTLVYGCGPTGQDDYEFTGELSLPGSPFLVGTTNVN